MAELHKDLRRLVKQIYGTTLRSQSIASIKHEISKALDSLLDEVQAQNDAKSFRSTSGQFNVDRHTNFRSSIPSRPIADQSVTNNTGPRYGPRFGQSHRAPPSCPICRQANRPRYENFLSSCPHLPESDKK